MGGEEQISGILGHSMVCVGGEELISGILGHFRGGAEGGKSFQAF